MTDLPWQGDALLLRRAIDNLIDNADRYAGAVDLHAAMAGNRMQLDVMDRGPGIAEDDRARLLQPFQRSESSRSRATGGTGLGLSIVRHIAQAHGGDVTVDSVEGEGSEFRLSLPVAEGS